MQSQSIYKQTPLPIEPLPMPRHMTAKEMITERRQRNSFWLNFLGTLVIFGIAYFLYSIYLERKIFSEYLDFIAQQQEQSYPGFL